VLLCAGLAPARADVLLTVAVDAGALHNFNINNDYTLDFQLNGGIGFYDPISVLIFNFQTDSSATDVPTTLAPGQSYTFAVAFLNPDKLPIKFTPLVFAVQ
jgi:hypothetical protein